MNDIATPLVQILLSTYNGERFLAEQLESLLAQGYPNVRVLIRDDGSSDGTLRVLEPYLSDRIELLQGSNIGVVRSFFALLEASDPEAVYIAFCDQDDVWLPHKVSRAVQVLRRISAQPALYCSRLILADATLKEIGRTPLVRREPSFANALLENIATGCTTLLNKEAKEILLHYPPDLSAVRMHDRWFYQTVSAFGKAVFDPEATIIYRQHASNVVGAKSTLLGKWKRRFQGYRSGEMLSIRSQAAEFLRTFDSLLKAEEREAIEELLSCRANFASRFRYFIGARSHRQTFWDTFVLRALIATGLV